MFYYRLREHSYLQKARGGVLARPSLMKQDTERQQAFAAGVNALRFLQISYANDLCEY